MRCKGIANTGYVERERERERERDKTLNHILSDWHRNSTNTSTTGRGRWFIEKYVNN